jgi:hypothetical protein
VRVELELGIGAGVGLFMMYVRRDYVVALLGTCTPYLFLFFLIFICPTWWGAVRCIAGLRIQIPLLPIFLAWFTGLG